jgi:hypothetical protein
MKERENQGNQQEDVVDKQTRNKKNTHKKEKFQVQEQQNFNLSSSGVILSAFSPCVGI